MPGKIRGMDNLELAFIAGKALPQLIIFNFTRLPPPFSPLSPSPTCPGCFLLKRML